VHVVSAGNVAGTHVNVTAELKPAIAVRERFTVPIPPGLATVTVPSPPEGSEKSGGVPTVITTPAEEGDKA